MTTSQLLITPQLNGHDGLDSWQWVFIIEGEYILTGATYPLTVHQEFYLLQQPFPCIFSY
jgi:hypothetical protein